jgi:hypothetical protein
MNVMTLWYWGGKLRSNFPNGFVTPIAGLILSAEKKTMKINRGQTTKIAKRIAKRRKQ